MWNVCKLVCAWYIRHIREYLISSKTFKCRYECRASAKIISSIDGIDSSGVD